MEKELSKRKSNRFINYDYSSAGAYFLTICTKERRNHFWKNVGASIARLQEVRLSEIGEIVDTAINNISNIYPAVLVEQYVIMPDHIHLLVSISTDEYGRPMVAPTMSRIVGQLKGYVTKKIGKPIWQKLYFDHIIRNRQDYEEHMEYIYENPIRYINRILEEEK